MRVKDISLNLLRQKMIIQQHYAFTPKNTIFTPKNVFFDKTHFWRTKFWGQIIFFCRNKKILRQKLSIPQNCAFMPKQFIF